MEKIKSKVTEFISENFISLIISAILFINATLYKETTIYIYIILLGILLVISWIYLIKNFEKLKIFLQSKYFIWITALFVLYEVYGFVRENYGHFNWDYMLMLYANVVTICALLKNIETKKILNTITLVCSLTTIGIGLYIVLNEFPSIISGRVQLGKSCSFGVNEVSAHFSVLSIPILYQLLVRNNIKYTIIYFIQLIFILLIGSKKAFLFIIIGIPIFYLYKNGFKFKKIIKLILIIIFIFFIIFKVDTLNTILGQKLLNFLGAIGINIDGAGYSLSTQLRLTYYKAAPELFLRSPILGGGWGAFAKYSGSDVYSHSNYIELLITFGVIGCILYYSMHISILKKSIVQMKANKGVLPFCYIILMLINDLGAVTFSTLPITYVTIFIAYMFLDINIENQDNYDKNISIILSKIKKLYNKIINVIKKPYKILIYLDEKRIIHLSDEDYLKLKYREKLNKKLNLKNPITFTEKLQWLKINDRNPKYTKMVDKIEAKKYVSELIGEEYIIPTLGIWNKFEDIDFEKLPNQFVMKCTHDSGGSFICKDKSKLDIKKIRREFNRYLSKDYYYNGREWTYKNIKPRIIIEKYMTENDGAELIDYKFLCFNGEPKLLSPMKKDKGETKTNFYDIKLNKLPIKIHYENFEENLVKPQNFEKMIEIVKRLSKGIPHVRVDLYNVEGKIYFGELTFYPGSGLIKFEPEDWDNKIGEWIELGDI